MEEKIVSMETAKLAKEKGFEYSFTDEQNYENWWEPNVMFYAKPHKSKEYRALGKMFIDTSHNIEQYKPDSFIPAPTLSFLHQWLNDNYGYIVLPYIADNGDGDWWITYRIWSKNDEDYIYESHYSTAFNSYEEAMERGLVEALTLIQN